MGRFHPEGLGRVEDSSFRAVYASTEIMRIISIFVIKINKKKNCICYAFNMEKLSNDVFTPR